MAVELADDHNIKINLCLTVNQTNLGAVSQCQTYLILHPKEASTVVFPNSRKSYSIIPNDDATCYISVPGCLSLVGIRVGRTGVAHLHSNAVVDTVAGTRSVLPSGFSQESCGDCRNRCIRWIYYG